MLDGLDRWHRKHTIGPSLTQAAKVSEDRDKWHELVADKYLRNGNVCMYIHVHVQMYKMLLSFILCRCYSSSYMISMHFVGLLSEQ